MLVACKNAVAIWNLETCKPLGWDASTWFTVLPVFSGIALYLIKKLNDRIYASRIKTGHVSGTLFRSRFRNVCAKIKPLMDDNRRIFSQFGPNSGASNSPKIVRFDLGIWYELRQNIITNNDEIRKILISNKPSIPSRYRDIFTRWLDHIDAFEAHIKNNSADYRNNRFPTDIVRIINDNV